MMKVEHTARLAKDCSVCFRIAGGQVSVDWNNRPRSLSGLMRAQYVREREIFLKRCRNAIHATKRTLRGC